LKQSDVKVAEASRGMHKMPTRHAAASLRGSIHPVFRGNPEGTRGKDSPWRIEALPLSHTRSFRSLIGVRHAEE